MFYFILRFVWQDLTSFHSAQGLQLTGFNCCSNYVGESSTFYICMQRLPYYFWKELGKIFNFGERRRLKPCLVLILQVYCWFSRHFYFLQIRFNHTSITFMNKNKHFSLISQFESSQSFRNIICPLISAHTVFAATSKVMIHLSLSLGL